MSATDRPRSSWEILPFMRGWALGSLLGGAGGVVVFVVMREWRLVAASVAIAVAALAAISQIGWKPDSPDGDDRRKEGG